MMYLFDDTPSFPQIGSSTRSLPCYTRFRFRSGESTPHRIKVYRGHIEGIDNCEMSFDIYLRWVGSLRIVIRLLMWALWVLVYSFVRIGYLHQAVRSHMPAWDLSKRLGKMNLQVSRITMSINCYSTFALQILFSPELQTCVPLIIRNLVLTVSLLALDTALQASHTSVRTCSI